MVKAKAKVKATKCCPRGVLEVEASPRGPPSLGFLPRDATQRAVMPCHLSVHHSQIQRPTAASCACVWSIVFMVLSPLGLLINHTQKFNVLRPDLEAKAKAAHHWGQGQGQRSSRPRPRPQNFVLEVSSRSTPVLEDPIPALDHLWMGSCSYASTNWWYKGIKEDQLTKLILLITTIHQQYTLSYVAKWNKCWHDIQDIQL